jgi:2-polyprenyl-3-methyl-5-hydroxy-6-metoxy-1,4-benzoquinol methylase
VRTEADYYRHHVHGPALLAAAAVEPGERALDLGCGEGYFARLLARAGARVAAIDLSPTLVEHACAEELRAPRGISYRVGSATEVNDVFAGERTLAPAR